MSEIESIPDEQTLFEVLPQNTRLNLGSRHESEQYRSEACEKRHPLGFGRRGNAQEIACDDANNDFN
jgi:hypothetical protein